MSNANQTTIAWLAAAVFATTFNLTANAHHSDSPFDKSKFLSFDATVVEFEWKNPHVFVQVEMLDDNGNVVELQLEGDGIPILIPHGWTRDSLKSGDQIKVEANPPRIAARRSLLGRTITREDGTVLDLNPMSNRSITPSNLGVASGLTGTWLPRWESFRGLFAGRDSWSYTDEGRRVTAAYNALTDSPQAHCVPFSAPRIMVYAVHANIEDLTDRVLINIDWMSVERVVYTDGRDHPKDGERTLQGHTIGRWEDDALVMDTTLFSEDSMAGLGGLPSGPSKRIEERLSLGDDRRTLNYHYVLADPKYLVEPITGSGVWDYRPDLQSSGTECDLESAQRYLESVR